MFHQSIVSFCFVGFSLFIISNQQNNMDILTKNLRTPLPSGHLFPMIGFGTTKIMGLEFVTKTLDQALAAGYRLFDTAQIYGNEEDIGKALMELLPKHNLTRKDIFITSKLLSSNETYGVNAYAALKKSLKTMNLEYLDLFLIHAPGSPGYATNNFSKLRDETWEQLAKGVKDGFVRDIGVSNYNLRHLTEVVNNDHGVKVAVVQVEWHPFYHQDNLREYCVKNGIILQGYSSLGSNSNSENFLDSPKVKKVAEKLGKLPSQILLRWALQQNVAVIPKSTKRQHMFTNIDLNFQIPDSDMQILSSFSERQKIKWDPDDVL